MNTWCENNKVPICGCYQDIVEPTEKDVKWKIYDYLITNQPENTKTDYPTNDDWINILKCCYTEQCNNSNTYKNIKCKGKCPGFCGIVETNITGKNAIIIDDSTYDIKCPDGNNPQIIKTTCSNNNNCPNGYICDSSSNCTLPTPNACNSNTDCKDGYICDTTSKTCIIKPTPNTCNSNTDCNDGYICDTTSKTCIIKPTPNTCNNDNDCPNGYICDTTSKTCKINPTPTPTPTPNACNSNTDCKDGYICDTTSKTCIVNPTPNACNSDNDCKDGKICDTTSKTCIVKTKTYPYCLTDNDCKTNEKCINNNCTLQQDSNTTNIILIVVVSVVSVIIVFIIYILIRNKNSIKIDNKK
jgi:hypothetical protein